MDKIKHARQELGRFFRQRRQEMGIPPEMLAQALGITPNTLRGVESGRFAWDMDLHFKICRELEIKPYFSATKEPLHEDYRLRKEDDPERYHGFYLCENLLLHEGQIAILKLTNPRLFLLFNYGQSYFIDFDDWVNNHTQVEWLDPGDKPGSEGEIDEILTDCWNFLALHERKEDAVNEEDEFDEYD